MLTLKFTESDLQILNEALVNMPYKSVAGLINSINMQLEEQIKKPDIVTEKTK